MSSSTYDITATLAPYLDSHHLVMLLISCKQNGIYPESEVNPVIAKLCNEQTELWSVLKEYTDGDIEERQKTIGERVENLGKEVTPILEALEKEVAPLLNCQKLEDLEKYGVTYHMLEQFYEWCFHNYQLGIYERCTVGLNFYQSILTKVLEPEVLSRPNDSNNESNKLCERQLNVKWGLLAAHIARNQYSEAATQAVHLDSYIEEFASGEKDGLSKQDILRARESLMHWMLFILFKSDSAKVLDLFMSEKFLALISLRCPHMLRYVAAAFIMHKKLKSMTKDIVHVLSQDKDRYSDALTEFLLYLHQDMDFDLAREKLMEIQAMCKKDYFLFDNLDTIVSNARLAIFSIYCRIHQSVDISTIADKMGMTVDAAESWIVGLIQSGKLSGACIDSSDEKSVFFPKEDSEVYSQVIEKTKNMSFRLFLLQTNAQSIGEKKSGYTVTNLSPQIAKYLLN